MYQENIILKCYIVMLFINNIFLVEIGYIDNVVIIINEMK